MSSTSKLNLGVNDQSPEQTELSSLVKHSEVTAYSFKEPRSSAHMNLVLKQVPITSLTRRFIYNDQITLIRPTKHVLKILSNFESTWGG